MKLVSHYLQSISGVEIYPILSFFIFFVFFIAVTWFVIKLDKKYITEVSNYALDGNEEDEKKTSLK